jgi:hypothetical protein
MHEACQFYQVANIHYNVLKLDLKIIIAIAGTLLQKKKSFSRENKFQKSKDAQSNFYKILYNCIPISCCGKVI